MGKGRSFSAVSPSHSSVATTGGQSPRSREERACVGGIVCSRRFGSGSLASVICLLGLLASITTLAQMDPDPDTIGIYFDEGATIHCIDAPVGELVTAYLCITHATALAGISGWEATIEVTEGVFLLEWSLRGDAINVLTPPEFVVGLATCLPWAPSIVLLEFAVGVFRSEPIALRVAPAIGPPLPPLPCPLPLYEACGGTGDYVVLGYAGGWNPVFCQPKVCAEINGDCNVLAGPEPSWGRIKAMYR